MYSIISYETIIAPHYEYCSSIFLSANEKDIIRLQKLQNKAMRIILKCDWYTHSEDMLKKLNWLSISEKIRYNSLVFIHKTLSKKQDNVFQDLYKNNNEVHNINMYVQDNPTNTTCNTKTTRVDKNQFSVMD
jgi:hypothetical protein